ncbi:hypothetical protein GCM10023191_022550 [Actinoallomurus oryzae]|uniref:Uncharacterized protein n=1 Tax=Actinoallomurus oryzae TaxID=502180 RepID=A0ABP8PPX2_9ACTN
MEFAQVEDVADSGVTAVGAVPPSRVEPGAGRTGGSPSPSWAPVRSACAVRYLVQTGKGRPYYVKAGAMVCDPAYFRAAPALR